MNMIINESLSSKEDKNNNFLTIVFLLLILQTLLIIPAVSGQSLQVDVWTNKGGRGVNNLNGGTYVIGEIIQICININMDVDRLRFYIITPDGRIVVYYDGSLSAGTRCMQGVEVGPPGVQRVIVEAWKGGQFASDEVRYTAIGCPPHGMYLGVDINIIDDENLEITGWFKPTDISWGDFVDLCWQTYPGKDRYISYLRNSLLDPMFGIMSASTLGSGLDESGRKVWLKLRVKFKDLSLSNYELRIIKFKDPIKIAGRGYVDEIRLTSFRDIWKTSPFPTSRTSRYVEWINRDFGSAPTEYEVYLYPLISIKVRVEGIPSDISVPVLINGVESGRINIGKSLEKNLLGEEHIVEVPQMIVHNNARFVCRDNVHRVKQSKEIIFNYHTEFRVIISATHGAGLTIDGVYYKSSELPFEGWWISGSVHKVIADEVGERREISKFESMLPRFSKWSDGITDRERNIYVSDSVRITAEYIDVKQYYVEVKSDYARAIGSGWYDKGSYIDIWLEGYSELEGQRAIVYISRWERVSFQGWSGDLKSTKVREKLLVDSPKSVIAIWKKQYYVEAKTPYSHIEGYGWYYEGDVARIALAETVVYTPDKRTRYVFEGWSGDYSGKEKEFSKIVNKPLFIKAEWFTEHLVTISTDPETIVNEALEFREKWVKIGNILFTTLKEEIQVSNDTKYLFSQWVVDGMSYSSSEINIIVDKPLQIIAKYEPWYYVLVRSTYGTTSGSGWYRENSMAEIAVNPLTVGFLITQIFEGWTINEELVSRDPAYTLIVDKPLTITAKWRTDYTGFILLIAILGSTFGAMSIVKVGGDPFYAYIYKMISRRKEVEPDVRRYDACINCGIILPPTLEDNLCPNCGIELSKKLVLNIPTSCPRCKAEISTLEFGSQFKEIRCPECGHIITSERKSQ